MALIIWGFPKMVVPSNHGVFLLKMMILGLWNGGTTIQGNTHRAFAMSNWVKTVNRKSTLNWVHLSQLTYPNAPHVWHSYLYLGSFEVYMYSYIYIYHTCVWDGKNIIWYSSPYFSAGNPCRNRSSCDRKPKNQDWTLNNVEPWTCPQVQWLF